MDEPISREIMLYQTGFSGENPNDSPLLNMTLRLDDSRADLNQFLIEAINKELENDPVIGSLRLQQQPIRKLPKKIIIIDASVDGLPLSAETERLLNYYRAKNDYNLEVVRVNTREEFLQEVRKNPTETLVLSQCVNKKAYNLPLANELLAEGVVVVPGLLTAPGGILSNKSKTYEFLSNNGSDWSVVTPYENVEIAGKSAAEVAKSILNTANKMHAESNITDFYIKPTEGGGGLGGFRMTKVDQESFVVSDLSKVSGVTQDKIQPVYLNIDPDDTAKIKELVYIFKLFEKDESMRQTYLWVSLDDLKARYQTDTYQEALARHLRRCNARTKEVLQQNKVPFAKAHELITAAIEKFNEKYPDHPYEPLVNKHIEFGTWGLRVHLRLTPRGIKIETIYARIFQLALTEDGVGYVGSDNISNKQTGKLEPVRMRPIEKVMLDAIGGLPKLRKALYNAAHAFHRLIKTLHEKEQTIIPLRVQMDMAPVSAMVCEGNADTARGLALGQNWGTFIFNNLEWFEHSLGYYSHLKK